MPRVDNTVFGYQAPPDTPALHRDVYKWIQSLDMSHALKNPRRDVSNGFLVAEIFSRYFPSDIQMHSFLNATSTHYKRDNWGLIQRFCTKQELQLPEELVEGTIQGIHGAAEAMLEHLYELFTNRKLPRLSASQALDLPSAPMQSQYMFGEAPGDTGGSSGPGPRLISSQVRSAQGLEFGEVQTKTAGDAIALRKKLAAQGS